MVVRTGKCAASAAVRFTQNDRYRTVTLTGEDAHRKSCTNSSPDGHESKEKLEDSKKNPTFNIQQHGYVNSRAYLIVIPNKM